MWCMPKIDREFSSTDEEPFEVGATSLGLLRAQPALAFHVRPVAQLIRELRPLPRPHRRRCEVIVRARGQALQPQAA